MSTSELDDMAEIANERAARICKLSADNIILNDRLEVMCADTARLDWLERNLMHLSHERATCSVDMGGRAVIGQLVNEARGDGGGPSAFRVAHPTIRQAIDAAMAWKKE